MTALIETDLNRKPDLEHERRQPIGAEAVAERSQGLFDSGMYCAESVLQAVAEAYGMMDPLIPKIATGFCGGISRTSGMCGALAGGIMALGLLTGRSSPQDSFRASGLEKTVCWPVTRQAAGLVEEVYAARGIIRHPLL